MEPWNDSSLLPPPVHTYKYDGNVDTKQLAHICNNIVKILSKQSPLHREAAICSRFLYKFDKKFRNDIGYRNLKKVNTALRKYLALNLLRDVENFQSVIPDSDEEIYVPTRQMLEYILVRLMTFSKILARISVCSKQAAIFYFDRVNRGESHWMSLMPFSLLSRIWSMSVVLLQHACTWYNNLYPFTNKLKLKGLDFLLNDYNLPIDIEKWIDLKNLDNFGRFNWSVKKQIDVDQSLIEDNEGDMFENIVEFVNQINEENPSEASDVKPPPHSAEEIKVPVMNVNMDQGEKISRDIFKSFFTTPEAKVIYMPHRVTNKESLHEFITREEKFRNEDNSQSLTSHLSFMQWQALKNSLMSLYESLSNNRKIEKKFQKLWKEKCLDCK